jgi:hypothetical protein
MDVNMSRAKKKIINNSINKKGFTSFFHQIPTWIKLSSAIIGLLTFVVVFLSYRLEVKKNLVNINVLVAANSTFYLLGNKAEVSPPLSIAITSDKKMLCGSNLIVSNNSGISTSIIGFQAKLSHESFPKPITFESFGDDIYISKNTNLLFEGLNGVHLSLLNDNPWQIYPEIFQYGFLFSDLIDFPINIQENSSNNIRVALILDYDSEAAVESAVDKFKDDIFLKDKGNKFLITIQFTTSKLEKTTPVEIICFEDAIITLN